MDFLPDYETLILWLEHYGSIILFILLLLGIVALPIPEETLMVLAGILMNNGKLQIPQTLLATFAGSICGITGSYLIGRTAGIFVIHRYGAWFGITEARFKIAHEWFEHYGKWSLSIGYFIPGIRHFTGVIAGTTNLNYKEFALFAYTGAFLWVSTFLSIGYFFGNYWLAIFEIIEVDLDKIIIVAAVALVIFAIYYFSKKYKTSK